MGHLRKFRAAMKVVVSFLQSQTTQARQMKKAAPLVVEVHQRVAQGPPARLQADQGRALNQRPLVRILPGSDQARLLGVSRRQGDVEQSVMNSFIERQKNV